VNYFNIILHEIKESICNDLSMIEHCKECYIRDLGFCFCYVLKNKKTDNLVFAFYYRQITEVLIRRLQCRILYEGICLYDISHIHGKMQVPWHIVRRQYGAQYPCSWNVLSSGSHLEVRSRSGNTLSVPTWCRPRWEK